MQTHFAHGEDHYWPEPLLGFVTQEPWKKQYLPQLKGKQFLKWAARSATRKRTLPGRRRLPRAGSCSLPTTATDATRWKGSRRHVGSGPVRGREEVQDRLPVGVHCGAAGETPWNSFMPKFNMKPDEVKALVVFLKSRKGMNFAETGLERYKLRLADAAKTEGGGGGGAGGDRWCGVD